MAEGEGQNNARTLGSYATPSLEGITSSIRRPAIQANNFEIKPAIIQMIQQTIQFSGLPNENPYSHIASFLKICNTFKANGVNNDSVRLTLFPFFLHDKAKSWLQSFPAGHFTIWDVLVDKFIAKFFPPSKTAKLRNNITTFVQFDNESLYEAWERFKELVRQCPNHGLPVWLQVQTFYNGMTPPNRSIIDAAAGGNLMNKTKEDGYKLLDEMTSNSYQWTNHRATKKEVGLHNVDAFTSLSAQISALNKKLDNLGASAMSISSNSCCQLCGQFGHASVECQVGNSVQSSNEQANFVSSGGRSKGLFGTAVKIQRIADNSEKNPREQLKAITLRSGKELKEVGQSDGKEQGVEAGESKQEEKPKRLFHDPNVKPYKPKIPFPQRFLQAHLDKQFSKFLEDFEMPLILGRPFLATGRALIDVQQRKLSLRIHDEAIVFNVFNAMKHCDHDGSAVLRIDVVDNVVAENFNASRLDDPIDNCIVNALDVKADSADNNILEAATILGEKCHRQPQKGGNFLPLDAPSTVTVKPSKEKPPTVELKPLPSQLKYVYLGDSNTLPAIISASLTGIEEEKLLRVLREHKGAIGWSIAVIKGFSPLVCMHKILLDEGHKLMVQPQRCLNPNMQEVGGTTVIKNENDELIPTRIITGWRVCIDYRKLNEATRKDHYPLPFIDQMIEKLAGHEYYCFLDGYFGYHQIPIAPEDQEKTTFTCPYGTFAFRRMPFGLCNAPGTFQRCVMALFAEFVDEFMEIFMDDFSVFGSSFDGCLHNLSRVLKRCEETNLVLNWEKCRFMVREGIVLGHKVSSKGIEVDRVKVEIIEKLAPPKSIKEIRGFLGHVGFYRRFIKDFSKIAKPLTNLLVKETPFFFDDDCMNAFQLLKEKLVNAPIVVAPCWNLPFEIMCDASNDALGAVLGQRKDRKFHTIYYASRTMNDAQKNYTTTEKKLLAVVFAFEKFRPYLILSKVIVHTDHSALKYLLAKKDAKPRFTCLKIVRIWCIIVPHLDLLHHYGQATAGLVASSHVASPNRALGALAALGSCITYALWLIVQTKMSEKYPCHYTSTVLMCVMGAIQSVAYALCTEKDWSQWRLGWNVRLLTVAYAGILSSGLMNMLISLCVRMRGPLYASIFNPLMLVLVAVAGSLFLEEKLYLGSVLGAVLIVLGLYIVLWGKGKGLKKMTQLMPSTSPQITEPIEIIVKSPTCLKGLSEGLEEKEANGRRDGIEEKEVMDVENASN
ncbi:hypothetical protein SLEP1_g33550 [Rubroshorea leprosula]|uniref:Reverse transcriptase n=1 Tax=Rubroshorea leprosula TaxID=152421 RepID=A0AAV5KGY8_9ROSI|nr:hypothetical protein SLEP1_g33550 [Rubroshorea leprosula]